MGDWGGKGKGALPWRIFLSMLERRLRLGLDFDLDLDSPRRLNLWVVLDFIP